MPDDSPEIQKLRTALHELEIINNLINKICRVRETNNIMTLIIDELVKVTEAEQGIINLISPLTEDDLITVVRKKKTQDNVMPFKLSNQISGWVLKNRKMIKIENLDKDNRFSDLTSYDKQYNSIVCYPMFVQDEIIGLTSLIRSRQKSPFSDDQYRLGGIIASQSAQILSNARLMQQLAQKNKLLKQQLIQVKELSAKTIEQERQASKQRIKQKLLEAEIAHKAKELEKAEQLKKAMTHLERAHKKLKETQTQLVQSEKMAALGMLVAGIAHEINTPIGAVYSIHDTLVRAIEKLKKTIKDKSLDSHETTNRLSNIMKIIDDANKVIKSGNERVIEIVKRLKSFARLDEAELKRIDINDALEDTLRLISDHLKQQVIVIKNFSDIPPVTCYSGQLNQVFLNILVNAYQAIENKGTLTVSTYQEGSNIHVAIKDTGVGIPPEQIGKIFDPGFTTKGVGVGTGLGLSICYQIIQDHQGEIEVESEPGKGTTFTIILPLNLKKSRKSNDNVR